MCFKSAILASLLAVMAQPASAAFDWQTGEWGVAVTMNGHPGSPSVIVTLPGGDTRTGIALEVYHLKTPPSDWRQHWVFLTKGAWRQAAPGGGFFSSYHLLRYWSSADKLVDDPVAASFGVLGVNASDQLHLALAYQGNDPVSGDSFVISADILLDPPDTVTASMTADVTTTNASGRSVAPVVDNFHGKLREQWLLFSIDSMYVTDNLTEFIPAWYDGLDPTHAYLGNTGNASFLDDGYSINGGINVSTHDTKFITAGNTEIALDHDMPWIVLPEFTWHKELVLMDAAAPVVWARHGYDPKRNHQVEILESSGLTANPLDLTWCATFKRDDLNMVDGDNVRLNLGLDAFLSGTNGVWPSGASQRVKLRLSAGEALNLSIEKRDTGLRVISNGGKLQSSTDLTQWQDVPGAHRSIDLVPNLPAEFFRQRLDVIDP